MKDSEVRFTMEELCALVDLPRRRIRFYMQRGLVDNACGSSRGSYYTQSHLDQLLTIRKWQEAGLSLERIAALIRSDDATEIPLPPVKPGSIKVWSHIHLSAGVELNVEPGLAGLSPEEVRELAKGITELLNVIRKGGVK